MTSTVNMGGDGQKKVSGASAADKDHNEYGELVCRSCSDIYRSPATHIANAYGGRHEEGSSWDWPVCRQHMPFAMCAGWFPIREVSEEPPFDPVAYIKGEPVGGRKEATEGGAS